MTLSRTTLLTLCRFVLLLLVQVLLMTLSDAQICATTADWRAT